jgi:hypothetical protein
MTKDKSSPLANSKEEEKHSTSVTVGHGVQLPHQSIQSTHAAGKTPKSKNIILS